MTDSACLSDARIGLIPLYDTTGITIRLHAPGCTMLRAKSTRMRLGDPVTPYDLEDWHERQLIVSVCRCATVTRG